MSFEGNLWLSAASSILGRVQAEPQAGSDAALWLPCILLIISGAGCRTCSFRRGFVTMASEAMATGRAAPAQPDQRTGTRSTTSRCLNANVEDLFHHVLAVLHDPAYRTANAGALRMEWPRIPLPGWPVNKQDPAAPDGQERNAVALSPEQQQAFLCHGGPRPGVGPTAQPRYPRARRHGSLRCARSLAAIAVPSTTDGRNMTDDDFAVTAGWGRFGVGQAVMPGAGRAVCPCLQRQGARRAKHRSSRHYHVRHPPQ